MSLGLRVLGLRALGIVVLAASTAAAGPRYDVTVAREGDVVEQIAPQRVITREEIEERSARTLDEALEFEPGVYIRNGNEGVPRVDMRGLRSRHVLLLLDGIPYNSTEDGQFDPALIPTEPMERIRLSFGNASALYGDGPMAGVIQIDTRQPEDGAHGSIGTDLRSERQVLGRFTASARRGPFDGFAAGSVFDRHGFPLSDDFDTTPTENGGRRDNSGRTRGNLLLKGGWTPSETVRIGALVSLLEGEYGIPPNVIADRSDPFASNPRYERVTDQWGVSGQLSTQWDPAGPFDARSWVFVNQLAEDRTRYDSDSYDSIADPTVNGTFRRRAESLVSGGAFHARYGLERWGRLKFAVQSRREDFDADGVIRDVRLGGGRFALRDFDDSAHQTAWSGGVEWEVEPFSNTGLVIGYDHAFLDKDRGQNDNGPIFLAGAFVDVRPGTRLRASASRKVRFPSLTQLYDVDGGNPDLKTEHAWNYEIGARQELPARTVVDLTAFWNDVQDLIERDEATRLYDNFEHYRFRGVELTVETHPLEIFDVRVSYGLLDAENRANGAGTHELQNRPQHRVSFEGTVHLPWDFAFRTDLEYVADQVVLSRNAPVQTRGTGDYVVVGLRLAKSLQGGRLGLYFGIQNLFDESYQRSYGVPDAGRVFYGGLEGRL